MTVPHPIPDHLAELIARRFRVLADPLRIRMLDQLREGELTVSELAERHLAGQQNVSKHLALLAEAGVLSRRKVGNRVYYAIADEGIFELCDQICGSLQAQFASLAALVGATATT